MGRCVELEGNGEREVGESNAEKIDFLSESITDPVVYQLVRVEGDGRLVPATDDEVIEVEHLLSDEKIEIPLEPGVPIENSSSNKSDVECSEGLSHSEITEDDSRKLNARLEYIEGMLRKVKQEERLRLSCESLHHSPKVMNVDGRSSNPYGPYGLNVCNDDLQREKLSHEFSHSTSINGSHAAELETQETYLESANEPVTSGSSVSEPCAGSKSDFLIPNGEICVDNLTVRELQEVFRVAFGRPTNVKDKRWLKRQIVMRISNSSENQAKFVVEVKNSSHSVQSSEFKACSPHTNQVTCGDLTPNPAHKMEDFQVSSNKRPRNPLMECNASNENLCMEQSAAKRVRKPNRRYMEELSEVQTRECTGKFSSLTSPTSRFRSVHNIVSQDTMVVTRNDSIGGLNIQIPYAYRVRRGRPRTNFVALMHRHPGGMAAKLVTKALGVCVSQHGDDCGSMIWKGESIPVQIQQMNVVGVLDQEKRAVVESDIEDGQDIVLEQKSFLYRGNSDEGANMLSSPRSGTKRIHHRAWTLGEVIKLVEGVARCGLGRWSKIKRLVFASCTYRTSVDLKDKWRNLLRASFTEGLKKKGARNTRKHASTSIPKPILLRVRKLAEMHSHTDHEFSSSKLLGTCRKSIQEKQPGFL